MADRVIINKKGIVSSVVITATSNATYVVAGNTSTSNVAMAGETIAGATISQIFWGLANTTTGYWTVRRGANTILILNGTGYLDFAGNGLAAIEDAGANVSFSITDNAVGTIRVELQKIPQQNTATDYNYI